MKTLNTLKRIIYSSAFVFTVTVFILLGMFVLVVESTEATATKNIPLSYYPWILLFSVILGALNNMLTAKSIPLAVRLPAHICGVLGAFYMIILRVLGLGQNGRGRFSVMAVAILLYAVILICAFFIRRGFTSLAKRYDVEAKTTVQSSGSNE